MARRAKTLEESPKVLSNEEVKKISEAENNVEQIQIKAEIRRIVTWQFDRLTMLNPEAYNSSLDMIADQIYALFHFKR